MYSVTYFGPMFSLCFFCFFLVLARGGRGIVDFGLVPKYRRHLFYHKPPSFLRARTFAHVQCRNTSESFCLPTLIHIGCIQHASSRCFQFGLDLVCTSWIDTMRHEQAHLYLLFVDYSISILPVLSSLSTLTSSQT